MTVFTPTGSTNPRIVVAGASQQYNGADIGIAQWNGSTWSSIATDGAGVIAMTPWNTPTGQKAVACGAFTQIGGVAAINASYWDGSLWHSLPHLGVQGNEVTGVTVWDPDGSGSQQPVLLAVGSFSGYVATLAWGDANWTSIGSTLNASPSAVTSWDPDGAGAQNPQIVVGGRFTQAGGITCNGIARWDGAWHPLGSGLESPDGIVEVNGLTSWDPDGFGAANPVVVVAGKFTNASGIPANGVAYWDGTAWHSMGTGPGTVVRALTTWDPDGLGPQFAEPVINGTIYDGSGNLLPGPRIWNGSGWQVLGNFGNDPNISGFASWDPDGGGSSAPAQLVACGSGLSVGTPVGWAYGVMHLVGNDWNSFDLTAPQMYSGAVFGGDVMVGGQFQMGADGIYDIDYWNGAWDGTINNTPSASGPVRAMKSFTQPAGLHSPELVVAGSFGAVGGVLGPNIAHYVSSLNISQTGWFPMASGLNATVYALERFGNLTYAAGDFTATGNGATALSHIARWDGSNWLPVTSISTGLQGVNGTVYALKAYNGYLYAGGSFTSAAGLSSGGLARYDGLNWSIVGANFSGTVYALEVFNSQLVIGGQYPGISGSPNLAQWNGTAYSTLGTGGAAGTGADVRALGIGPDGQLYVGGDLTSAGGVACNNLARWSGSAWSDAYGGTNGSVYAIFAYRNELHVLGAFGKCGSSTVAAPGWARYTFDDIPWVGEQISKQPGLTPCIGGYAIFQARCAVGFEPVTATWRHNGIPIPQVNPWGSDTLFFDPLSIIEIENLQPQDRGNYDVVYTNACGTATTAEFFLNMNTADFNGDGDIGTDADIESFFACLAGNCCPTCGTADFNGDGDTGTDADIEAFFRVLAGGPC